MLVFEGFAPFEQVAPKVGLVVLFVNANLAMLLNIAVVFLIGCSSSLVLTLSGMSDVSFLFRGHVADRRSGISSGVVKDLLLVGGSVVFFKSPITGIQVIGYGIALSGLMVFKTSPVRIGGVVKSFSSTGTDATSHRK